MGFWSKTKINSESEEPILTALDKQWVESNMKWLRLMKPENKAQFSFDKINFPETFKDNAIDSSTLVADISKLLSLDNSIIEINFIEDITSTYGLPYSAQEIFKSDLQENDHGYKIILGEYIIKHPKQHINRIICECIKIKLLEDEISFDTGSDTDSFIFLAAIHYGFGLILSQNLIDVGTKSDGAWVSNWRYSSAIPFQVMAYALAFYCAGANAEIDEWEDSLSDEFRRELHLSHKFVKSSISKSIPERMDNILDEDQLYNLACNKFKKGHLEEAISILHKVVKNTKNQKLKFLSLHNIGYYLQTLGRYKESIEYFHLVLEYNPGNAYANDNLGFAYVLTGQPEKGKFYIDLAINTGESNLAYSYRNTALYFGEIKDMDQAEKYFQKSLEIHAPVDLLEYFYGKHLLAKGKKDDAIEYLTIAANKGEMDALELLQQVIE